MKREERITFQEESTTYDEYNQPVTTWANIATTPTMWARAKPRTGNEDFRGDQKSGFQRYDFNVLHRTDLSIQMRISWDGRFWDIKAIEPRHDSGRNKSIEITAEWRQGQYE